MLLVVTSPPDLALPLPGRGDEPLNLVPIDWVARASVALGRDPRARGRTFHLVDPHPLTTRRVFELVARAGGRRGPRGSIPANLAKALLRAPGLDRIAKSPRALPRDADHAGRRTTPATPTSSCAALGVSLVPAAGVVRRQAGRVRAGARAAAARHREAERRDRGPAWLGDGQESVAPLRRRRAWSCGASSCARATSCSSRGSIEASEGLAAVFAERGGDLSVAAPADAGGRSSTPCSTCSARAGAAEAVRVERRGPAQ